MKSKSVSPQLPLVIFGLLCLSLCACESTPSKSAASPTRSAPDPTLLQQADEAYAHRAEPERLRAGLEVARRTHAAAPFDYDAAWRLARLAYTLGDQSKDDTEREAAFREGVEAGETAVSADANRAEGHFWLGANYGGLAEIQGTLGLDYADKLRREMETTQRLDAGLYGGSTYMALGRLDLEMPEWLGGDRPRALATLEKGLQYGPQNSMLRLQLAQAYLANKKNDETRKQLNFLLAMKPDPAFLPEYDECATEARQLLKKHE